MKGEEIEEEREMHEYAGCSFCGIEHRIRTKKEWAKTIVVPVDVLSGEMAV